MDLETYETKDIPKPDPSDIEGTLEEGATVEYWIMMGSTVIRRVKGAV